jgi:hypothetical protein
MITPEVGVGTPPLQLVEVPQLLETDPFHVSEAA